MTEVRIEKDSMGELEVPKDALYGAQTQRAINNFNISHTPMPEAFIRALIQIKSAAATVNVNLKGIDEPTAQAIKQACTTLLDDKNLMHHFPVDVFQTGSGTSTNMNANEVIANLASKQSNLHIHPNDHVNFGQSSNDVIPTCIHVSAALAIHQNLMPSLRHLAKTIDEKSLKLAGYCKTGRTHLMDAMPIRMDQSMSAWSAQIKQQISHLESLQPSIQSLVLGGTAVGTGINSHPDFADQFSDILSRETDVPFVKAANFFAGIAAQDSAVSLSGLTKSIAVSFMKIANDLRWMNSGPLAGLGEIALPALQPGSSIMPGKVNPVIPEAVAMLSAQVIGNDSAITIGGQSGNFELNVMLPMIALNLLSSIELLSNGAVSLADYAIRDFEVNQQNLEKPLHKNPILVTALNPIIGYAKAAEIAKKAYKENRPIIDVAAENTDIPRTKLEALLDPVSLTKNDS
ncbi:class II fumarate hydratase [Aliiglaciecola sp. 3_MG-2023]|uniref:class II fumarate hydratase n=1 Tax=Aliiglaciecola sp. 3_MG-2023 TaxID=3062644 RepID=UPI0026E2A210|nr:class II fumarate hydratase [Aliiglaciecola sp. 3_MG-2023]MDO6695398.1 class II fumarate hydratase [Aliiglaciecola sp. 3_MG-2023]